MHHSDSKGAIFRNVAEWVGLIAVFLVAGAVGHDPWWKRGEAYGFGIIYDFYESHHWLIPRNAGNPFMEKPPLYYWTATLFCRVLGNILPLHDAARLASVFYSAIAAFFTWKTANVLFRDRADRTSLSAMTLALLLGSYGLVHYAHAMITDTALLAGAAIALYGMAGIVTQPERRLTQGAWLGIGAGICFMTKGLLLPGVIAVACIILCALLPRLRTRATFHAFLAALASAAPFLFVWPLMLYADSPALFVEWFWHNNVGRFLGFSTGRLGAVNRPLYFLWMAPIFAFPAFPLACGEAIFSRKEWRGPEYLIPLVFSGVGMLALLVSASGRDVYLLPLIPAFALLAAQVLARLPGAVHASWNRGAQVAFSAALAVTWGLWWTLRYPQNVRPLPWLSELFHKSLPISFIPPASQPVACATAVAVLLFWCASLRFDTRSALSTARIWLTGAAAIWCTSHTLLLPWINEAKSFRTVLTQMTDFIAQPPYASDCVGSFDLGENITPMLHYFTGSQLKMPPQGWDGNACPLMLTFVEKTSSDPYDTRWHLIWKGARFNDIRNMELRLYARQPAPQNTH